MMDALFTLQNLEFTPNSNSSENEAKIQELRSSIPEPILAHYDRMRVRGKRCVALLRNGVCGECHLRQPTGVVGTLRRGTDIQLCTNCGRYLHLQDQPVLQSPAK